MKKIIFILISLFILSGCIYEYNYDDKYKTSSGIYTNMPYMLKQCDSFAIVIYKEYKELNIDGYKHVITVIDSKSDMYTYAGNKSSIEIGHIFYLKSPEKNKKNDY